MKRIFISQLIKDIIRNSMPLVLAVTYLASEDCLTFLGKPETKEPVTKESVKELRNLVQQRGRVQINQDGQYLEL